MYAETVRTGMTVTFRRDGSVRNATTPASSGEAFVVAAEQTRGAVDQLTAYAYRDAAADAGSCSLVVRSRRYRPR